MSKIIDQKSNPDEKLNVSRRTFLSGSATAGLCVAVGSTGALSISSVDAHDADRYMGSPWVSLVSNGTIEIIFPSTELGQGSSTSLPVILAEELDANWDDVVVRQLNEDDRTFGNPRFGGVLYTAGSTAVTGYFDPMRKAGAQVKSVLLDTVAQHWNVPKSRLSARKSMITDTETGKQISYGDVVMLAKKENLSLPNPDQVTLKKKSEYTLIGSDLPRRDIPAKSDGSYKFGIDVRVPGMVYASVVRAPVEGEVPTNINDADTLATDRVLQTLVLPDGVAVIAETLEAAFAGRAALDITWSENSMARQFNSDQDLVNYAAKLDDPATKGAVWSEAGDADTAISAASKKVTGRYYSDYASHAQFEPMSAVAHVTQGGKKAEAWIGSQSQTLSHYTIRDVLGIENEDITIHMMPMGGSFGRRTELVQPYLRDALLSSKAVGKPVKVIWTREDDMKFGAFRPAAVQDMEAGLDNEGNLAGWKHRVATASVIQYFNPVRWKQVAPNDVISAKGTESKFYDLPDKLAEHVIMERSARLAPWRGIGMSYTSFAAEAFMDEVATEAGIDPVTFRMNIMKNNPRGQYLLKRVVEMAEWDRPREGRALGLSFAGYGESMSAGIAEISLDRDSGEIKVHKFWTAIDAGLVISPSNTLAQMEGGIIWGIGSSLREAINITNGEVDQSNYYDYSVATIYDLPEIQIEIADVDAHPTQIGELGNPMVPGAIANAFFALTGKRIRHMPFTPDRVLEVLEA